MDETPNADRHGLRAHARMLSRGEPGHRFVAYHDWRAERIRHRWIRPVYLTLSMLLIPAGLIMLVTPGPGVLMLIAGLGLVAQASRRWAVWLDQSERWCRRRLPARRAPDR